MNNEIYYKKKYLTYKIKYLKQKLNTQSGGSEEDISLVLPKDISKIIPKKFNVSEKSNPFIINRFVVNNNKELETILNEKLKNKTAHIWFETKTDIYLTLNDEELRKISYTDDKNESINIEVYNLFRENKIDKLYITINKKYINEEYDLDDNTNLLEKEDPNKKIQLQINLLKEELDKLKNEFSNHYHDIPTTGMRQFEQSHPFYKKI